MTASKFNETTRQVILEAIRSNLTQKLAADYARVSTTILEQWLSRGREDERNGLDTEYARFVGDIKRIRGDAAKESLDLIAKAGRHPKRWTARAWLLERLHRSEYSQQGDQFEKISKELAELRELVNRRKTKRISGDSNGGQVDKESD